MIPFDQTQVKITSALDHIKQELSAIRTGRANPQILENVSVNAYGQQTNLIQVAGINVVDATLITVQPWDKSIGSEVETAINAADLGLNATKDGDIIRVSFPPLTEDRRKEYVKLMKEKIEEGRIEIRVIRKDILAWLDSQDFSEDDRKVKEKSLQDIVDRANEDIEELRKKKEEELMTV